MGKNVNYYYISVFFIVFYPYLVMSFSPTMEDKMIWQLFNPLIWIIHLMLTEYYNSGQAWSFKMMLLRARNKSSIRL